MTVIGKSPTPRTGHTFADVPVNSVVRYNGVESVVRIDDNGRRYLYAIEAPTALAWPGPDAPVTLLTPAEPKPALESVTTYGELKPGQYAKITTGAVIHRTSEGHVYIGGGSAFPPAPGVTPVRVLSPLEVAEHFASLAGAHVVVPEEPGEVARREADGTYTVEPGKMNLWMLEKWAGEIAWLYAEGLAQQDAAPESEPTEDRSKPGHLENVGKLADALGLHPEADARVARALAAKREGWDIQPLEGPSELHPMEPTATQVEADIDAALDRPAEDRTKPAPGFPLDVYDLDRHRVKIGPLAYSHPQDQSEAGAIEHSWELYDNERA